MPIGKLEGRIRVPTGGWAVTLQEFGPNAGPFTVTVPAGDYYLNSVATGGTLSLLNEFGSQLSAAGAVYAVTSDDDTDTGTGKTLIEMSDATTFNITWLNTDFRDALGFTGNLTGAASYVSDNHALYLHLPSTHVSGLWTPDGDVGLPIGDGTLTVGPAGDSYSTSSAERFVNHMVLALNKGFKTWDSLEVVQNEALQVFWEKVFRKGLPFRYHQDRNVDGTYVSWQATGAGMRRFHPTPHDERLRGPSSLWTYELDVIKFTG